MTKFVTKEAQIFGDFFGYFEKCHILNKKIMWLLLGNIWYTLGNFSFYYLVTLFTLSTSDFLGNLNWTLASGLVTSYFESETVHWMHDQIKTQFHSQGDSWNQLKSYMWVSTWIEVDYVLLSLRKSLRVTIKRSHPFIIWILYDLMPMC